MGAGLGGMGSSADSVNSSSFGSDDTNNNTNSKPSNGCAKEMPFVPYKKRAFVAMANSHGSSTGGMDEFSSASSISSAASSIASPKASAGLNANRNNGSENNGASRTLVPKKAGPVISDQPKKSKPCFMMSLKSRFLRRDNQFL